MNKARRSAIAQLVSDLEAMKDRIEEIASEEQEYFDNMPESFQISYRGTAAEEAASALESAASLVDEAISALEDASA